MSNLGEVRALFAEWSGRYDLVTPEGENNGADAFINAGQRMLDLQSDFAFATNRHFYSKEIGSYSQTFDYCRTIDQVWVRTTTARWELKVKALDDLLNMYPVPLESSDYGEPLYWARGLMRAYDPEVVASSLGTYLDNIEPEWEKYKLRGIAYGPPNSETIILEVRGKFYTPKLISNTNTSYWAYHQPELLAWASLYQLEVSLRNMEGARGWKEQVDEKLRLIDFDNAEEESINQLEG